MHIFHLLVGKKRDFAHSHATFLGPPCVLFTRASTPLPPLPQPATPPKQFPRLIPMCCICPLPPSTPVWPTVLVITVTDVRLSDN